METIGPPGHALRKRDKIKSYHANAMLRSTRTMFKTSAASPCLPLNLQTAIRPPRAVAKAGIFSTRHRRQSGNCHHGSKQAEADAHPHQRLSSVSCLLHASNPHTGSSCTKGLTASLLGECQTRSRWFDGMRVHGARAKCYGEAHIGTRYCRC